MGFGGQKNWGRQEIFLAGCRTAELLLLTSFTVMRLATTGYADEISSQNILKDGNA